MKQQKVAFILTVFCMIISFFYHPVSANVPMDKHEIQILLTDAYEAQKSLTQAHYSWKEATSLLYEYMSKSLALEFLKEHVVYEKEGYICYGTDFSIYVIPQLSFTETTKMTYDQQSEIIYVYEKSFGDGPVLFDNQYDLIAVEYVEDKWKIKQVSFVKELPSYVVKNDKKVLKMNNEKESTTYKKINNDKSKKNIDFLFEQNPESKKSIIYVKKELTFNPPTNDFFYEIIGIRPYPSLGMFSKHNQNVKIQHEKSILPFFLSTIFIF